MEQLINIVWVFLGAVLVMFMQAGFAVLEVGFTRHKNANNVLMKNVMDFSIGSLLYYFVGFGIMFGVSLNGFMGTNGTLDPLGMSLAQFDALSPEVFIFFQTVFCATAATIVSGAMAERTKFSSYLIYTIVISLIIYPVTGHWIWGGGFLSQMGFIDYAGSAAVHAVGGFAALVGAKILGPRVGKYGKNGKVNAIPGHNIPLGALGVFILWFCWFGFNAGSSLEAATYVGHIAITTNLAAAAGALITMGLTWMRYGKPDISMTLNGVLAGLVAITAGCHIVSPIGAVAIGAISGLIVTFGIEFMDKSLKIDDPVGAVGVHCFNGVWGTIAVGLFATNTPAIEGISGLLYGGGFELLIVQTIGIGAVGIYVSLICLIMFLTIKKTVGLRVSKEEEIEGLDIEEHGSQAYPDFVKQ